MREINIISLLKQKNEFDLSWLYGNNFCKHKAALKAEKTGFLFFYKIFSHFAKALSFVRLKRTHLKPNQIVFFAASKNQADCMINIHQSLCEQGADSVFIVTNEKLNKMFVSYKNIKKLSMSLYDLISIIFISIIRVPFLFKTMVKKNMLHSKVFANFDVYLLCHLYLALFSQIFKACPPIMVILSNDHNSENRSIAFLCKLHNIKVCYVQHASVSPIFPPLNQFHYAFLDGEKSYNIYNDIIDGGLNDSECEVHLTGILSKTINNGHNVELSERFVFGVSISLLDSFEKVKKLIDCIKNKSVVIRPHPQQGQLFISNLESLVENNVFVSIAKNQTQADYFSSIDIHLAGESGIHLEALLSGTNSYHVDIEEENKNYDYYGFINSGLISNFNSISCNETALISDLQKKAIRSYSATYGTKWEKKEHLLVANNLLEIIKQGSIK